MRQPSDEIFVNQPENPSVMFPNKDRKLGTKEGLRRV